MSNMVVGIIIGLLLALGLALGEGAFAQINVKPMPSAIYAIPVMRGAAEGEWIEWKVDAKGYVICSKQQPTN
jgi:hypothetical protein